MNKASLQLTCAVTALALMAACGPVGGLDADLRGWIPGGLDTAAAASRAAPRPQPDSRGLITLAQTQAAVARAGDTPATVAARLGFSVDELARHNGLPANATLSEGAVLVLPRPVAPGVSTAEPALIAGQIRDPFAGQPPRAGAPAVSSTASPKTAPSASAREHVVAAGETSWSIARRYGVSVQDVAAWNGLSADMGVRIGQRLLIPVAGAAPPDPARITTQPGTGSPTPRPPSADEPLPDEQTSTASDPGPKAPEQDLGATRTAASGSGRFRMPVSGAIIRVYEKGRNEGIDIAAPSGTAVDAAGAGTVAAITRDTAGVPIVVVRHDDNLMTVYTGMDTLDVTKGQKVSAGQPLGAAGDGGFVHFEVRRGFESTDPEAFLN